MALATKKKNLARNVSGSLLPAPPAPSAPPATPRSGSGSPGAAAARGNGPNLGRPPIAAPQPQSLGRPSMVSQLGDPMGNNTPRPREPRPSQGGATPKPPGPGSSTITDPQYWNNVLALNQQYLTETANLETEQTLANTAYLDESERMATNRSRARRNLAESLLGSGAMYGGRHRRDQTEDDHDYALNAGRLSDDFATQNEARIAERADIESRLAYETGTDYLAERLASQDRDTAETMAQAESGEPIGKMPGLGKQIQSKTKRIKALRKRVAEVDDPKKKAALRKRIQKNRRQRDALVKKRKAK